MNELTGKLSASTGEFLLLPDGTLLIHNLTPAIAEMLASLNGVDAGLQARLGALGESADNHDHADHLSGN